MRPLRGLQETRVATREESGVLGFPSSICISKQSQDTLTGLLLPGLVVLPLEDFSFTLRV